MEIAVGGKDAGLVFEGDRRFELVVRLPEHLASDVEAIKALPDAASGSAEAQATAHARGVGQRVARAGPYVPLSAVAQIEIAPGPNQISRENGKRRIVVSANVRERDLGSFVAEAQRRSASRSSCRPATGSAGAASSSNWRPPRSGSPSSCRSRCC